MEKKNETTSNIKCLQSYFNAVFPWRMRFFAWLAVIKYQNLSSRKDVNSDNESSEFPNSA